MKRALLGGVLLLSFVMGMLSATGTSSGSTIVVVDPTNMNGWGFLEETATATGSMTVGPATPPLGTGSAQMTTVNATGGMLIGTVAHVGTPFSAIDDLEYSTYTSSAPQAPSLQFGVDYDLTDGDTGFQGRLVFEPYLSFSVTPGVWQTWDPQAGGWWATGGVGAGTCTMSSLCSWADVLLNWPDAGVHATPGLGATLFKVGSSWPAGVTGAVDAFTIGISSTPTTFDFEPLCTADCYVRTDGNDANPGTADTPALAKRTIQAALDQVAVGGTVHVAAGVYDQNLTVTKTLTLDGAGQGSTTVRPGLSGAVCGGGSLCPGHSSAILVQAHDVEISDLAVDGDNTTIASSVLVGGADVEARNGIIENHAAGVFNSTHIHDVTVRNIYLRGIQVGSGGSGFIVEDNTVLNVQGDPGSIAIFNFGGSGTFDSNNVTDANDGVASNWSRGTTYTNNVITSSGSGVHSDNNGGSGGGPDLLENNTVSNCDPGGYGVWTFAQYNSIIVRGNTVTNCAVGLATFGQQSPFRSTSFIQNEVDGQNLAGSAGGYFTTSLISFGDTNVDVILSNNKIRNTELGALVESNTCAGPPDCPVPTTYTANVTANRNEISGNVDGVQTGGTGGTINADFRINWWESDTGPAHVLNPLGVGDSVSDGILYSPWLGIGTDAAPAIGFQLASPMTWVVGPDVCGATCIQAAIDYSANGDTVKVLDGLYPENVLINKEIAVTQGSLPIIDGGGLDVVTITADNVTLDGFEIKNGPNGVVLAVGADNATVQNNEVHTFTSAGIRGNGSTGADINHNLVTGPHVASTVGGFWGILVNNTSGSITFNDVSGIGNGLLSGNQEGRAIEAQGAGTLDISDNDVSQYQKSGIIVRGTVNSTIDNNTASGEGVTTAIAMNGITVVSTGTTSITGNHVNSHHYTSVTDPNTFSCGILYVPFGSVTGALIDGNDSTNDEVGICLSDAFGGPVSDVDVTNNEVDSHRQRGIDVDGMTNVLVDDNDIDGNGQGTTANGGTTPDDDTRYYGIFVVDSTGTVSNNDITGIAHGVANGTQSGVGIRATARSGGATDVDITSNVITDIQKNAMVITNAYGGTVNADVIGNTTTGNGPISYIAQNGIQVSGGATSTINGNIVSNYDYTPATFAAAGILVFGAGTTTVSGNIINNVMEGIYVQQSTVPTVSGNIISNSPDSGIVIFLQTGGSYSTNTVTGSSIGIYGGDNNGVLIDANILTSNDNGVYIDGLAVNTSVTNNRIQTNDIGINVQNFFADIPTGTLVNNNCIVGNTTFGMRVDPLVSIVNAENNWWGRVIGPNPPGTGDAIDSPATIDATPFLTSTTAGCPVPDDGDGDGIIDVYDNCVITLNAGQENFDAAAFDNGSAILGHDITVPNADIGGDVCDPDDDNDGVLDVDEGVLANCGSFDGTVAGHPSPARNDSVQDDNQDLNPAPSLGTDGGDNGPSWDTDGDGVRDGSECLSGTSPRLESLSHLAACNSYMANVLGIPALGDSDGDGLRNGWEFCKWGTDTQSVDTDGDAFGDCTEVMDVNGNAVVTNADAVFVKQAYFGLAGVAREQLFDINGNAAITNADATFIQQAVFLLMPCS